MKYTLSILLVTMVVYAILCFISYFIFPDVDNFVLSRMIAGLMAIISWGIAMFVVKKITKVPHS